MNGFISSLNILENWSSYNWLCLVIYIEFDLCYFVLFLFFIWFLFFNWIFCYTDKSTEIWLLPNYWVIITCRDLRTIRSHRFFCIYGYYIFLACCIRYCRGRVKFWALFLSRSQLVAPTEVFDASVH